MAPILLLAALAAALPQSAFADGEASGPQRVLLEAVGTERIAPNVFHLMMKMEQEAGLVRDAIARGEARLREFLAAADTLKIAGLTYKVTNNVITPSPAGAGIAYSRNIVFTIEGDTARQAGQRDKIVAALEDLGARYNSHCVTCIGSG